MSRARAVLDLLLPPRCAGCGAPGSPCCPRCRAQLADLAPVSHRWLGSAAAATEWYSLASYRGVARTLVLAYKERGRRDLAPALGHALADGCAAFAPACQAPDGTVWLVPIPSRRSASRMRGGPHMLRLARHCARMLAGRGYRVAVAPALSLASGAKDQVGLDRSERSANLAGRVRVVRAGAPPPGTPVVLLDDVLTTGATAEACITALRGAGLAVAAVLALTSPGR